MGLKFIGRSVLKSVPGLCLMLWLLSGAGAAGAAAEPAAQWLLVRPPEFKAALEPLVQHRQAQGFKVVVLGTTEVLNQDQLRQGDGAPLQRRLNELLHGSKGRSYVLLAGMFGSADSSKLTNPVVPALRGVVGRMKGEPTDSGYGLPDRDGAPTVAVGRFPARTVEEASAMVQKTLSFEREGAPGAWRSRLLLLLGNPGGGPMAEMFVEQTLAADLATLHPAWEVRTLFNAASSVYYLPRPRDREAALRYLREGNLFSVYLGHSGAEGMGLDARFLTRDEWTKLSIPKGDGPLFTCGCFACQSNAKGDGYGLAAMRNPAGPVAVMGASGESYSAAGQLAVEGLLSCLQRTPFPSRLGDYWLAVGAGLARGKMDQSLFALLDMADGSGSTVPLATQRLEHLEMWTLQGDPALGLPVTPVDIALKPTEPVCAGKTLEVSGLLPDGLRGATVHVALERPRNSVPASLEALPPNTPANRQARQRAFLARHQSANAFVLASVDAPASGNEFAASLKVPDALPWSNVVVRASATVSNETGIGAIVLPAKVAANAGRAR